MKPIVGLNYSLYLCKVKQVKPIKQECCYVVSKNDSNNVPTSDNHVNDYWYVRI